MSDKKSINLALVGCPNCGKTSLYNALTGHRQKVGNYPGVTVERRTGRFTLGDVDVDVVDLPGIYSMTPESTDQKIARSIILGEREGESVPDVLLCVIDATKVQESLRFILEVKALGRPMMIALNMMDMARRDGTEIDLALFAAELGVPVVETVAVRKKGIEFLLKEMGSFFTALRQAESQNCAPAYQPPCAGDVISLQKQAKEIACRVIVRQGLGVLWTRRIDSVLLHPILGLLIFIGIMFFMFQAVFSWAELPMGMIDNGIISLQAFVTDSIDSPALQSLFNDGVLAGIGSVVIFLPQILILFFFIMILEQSGYMSRAAFLVDKIMSNVGLSGHAFIPLLSSFACAIPGIMAARTIDNERDRLMTILVAPLMACSARLPVYTLIIAAFIPNETLWGLFSMQGMVMFCLYMSGAVGAMVVAGIAHIFAGNGRARWFLMELPRYRMPCAKNILLGLWDRARVFLKRAGTIIMASTVLLWLLASYPAPPEGADEPAIVYSAVGIVGHWLEVIFAPIGFGWEICVALIPGMAAREIAVSALGTVYALQGSEDAVAQSLTETLRSAWGLPTGLAFLVWYIFAPQCISTLAVVRRETNGWLWPIVMFVYMFAMAYIGAGLTYHITSYFMGV